MFKTKKVLILVVAIVAAVAASATVLTLTLTSSGSVKVRYFFETNGGSPIESVELDEGEGFTPDTPVKEGYIFDGWYDMPDYSGTPLSTVSARSDRTFYAKWSKAGTVTLNADGGTLPGATSFLLREGENLYDAVKDLTPSKSGLSFGAWFIGENELRQDYIMPDGNVTLKAGYKADYTVHVYAQSVDLSGYEKLTDITGSDYVNKTYKPEAIRGFTAAEDYSFTIADHPADNVFDCYYDRGVFTVRFNSAYPDGSAMETVETEFVYGQEVEFPYDKFKTEGYVITAWKVFDSKGSGEDIASDYLKSVAYGYDGEYKLSFLPYDDMRLYASWTEGKKDMFGGSDEIYIVGEGEEKEVFLYRGGISFKGEYISQRKEFIFYDGTNTVLRGRLIDDERFAYRNLDREENYYTLFVRGKGVDNSVNIKFDAYNGVTYYADNGAAQSVGTYSIVDDRYVVNFTEGELAGTEMLLVTGVVSENGNEINAFQVRNETEYGYGDMLCFEIDDQGRLAYFPDSFGITLDGFGIARYNYGPSVRSYYYKAGEKEGVYELSDSGGIAGMIKVFNYAGQNVYAMYDEALDNTFKTENGGVLTLDGTFNAVYESGDRFVKGYYVTSASVLGGTIVHIYASTSEDVILRLTENVINVSSGLDGENQQSVITYEIEEQSPYYAEYYFSYQDTVYYAPMFVKQNETEAFMYGYNGKGEYHKVSEGRYYIDDVTGHTVYEAQRFFDADVETGLVDLGKVKRAYLETGLLTINLVDYYVNYWFSYDYDEVDEITGEPTEKTHETELVVYTDGDNEFYAIGGFGYYTENGETYVGALKENSHSGVIVIDCGDNQEIVLRLNGDEKTFVRLEETPHESYLIRNGSELVKNEYLAYDGNGGVVYTIRADEPEDDVFYSGVVEDTGKVSLTGLAIYRFSSSDKTIEFLSLNYTVNSVTYSVFSVYNEEHGDYYYSDTSVLILDGFSYKAKYDDEEYNYYVVDDMVVLMTDGKPVYIDVDKDSDSFTVKGDEYGVYWLTDNQLLLDVFIEFDGYSAATVFSTGDDDARNIIDENAVYTLIGGYYVVVYNDGGEQKHLTGVIDTVMFDNNSVDVFVLLNDEAIKIYIEESDWSVLVLDGVGHAGRFDKFGMFETGDYVIITDKLFYYVSDDLFSAYLYHYDNADDTITVCDFAETGYYTEALDSMQFSRSGYAIFNGTEQKYYDIVDGEAIIYTRKYDDPSANEYGFVSENIGSFTDTITYREKTYYKNSGYAVRFANLTTDYPITLVDGTPANISELTFVPSGEAAFSISGTVKINGVSYPCYVVREEVDGVSQTFIAVSCGALNKAIDVGYMRFDVQINYKGEENSSYSVTGLKEVRSAMSYVYMNNYYIYYILYSASVADAYTNEIGNVEIVYEYDKNGLIVDKYFNGTFGAQSRMLDTDGEIVNFKHSDFTETQDGNYVIYTAEIVSGDGNEYELSFLFLYHSAWNSYGYVNYLFTLKESFDCGDYTVTTKRLVASDYGYAQGVFADITLFDGENNAVEFTDIFVPTETHIEYIVRKTDEAGKIVSTVYYVMDMVLNDIAVEEKTDGVLYPAKSMNLRVEPVETVYSEDGNSYVDISSTEGVKLLCIGGDKYYVISSEYDTEKEVYKVRTSEMQYTVKIVDGKAVITKVYS